eukprot:CAMPEP_0113303236 /NCGR_PEP_ID=MMETSP0010_2-20120614/3738_1 /TAXON_ID=216773 ORGANISM="Corethron hystrix, Strain 308" /NCGR_SAMPLE_ID=MMETSP0010_2 /ASSEMBLY_ACC=CAM_ASM_000155 /LENGTH=101 /DNA_ID=CAMNT_0000157203 /DNA_START=303 /DNA_END=605 /DNA_ORIENTATION=+ /assembly_acc=CAM_ASM_000155
MAYGDNDEIVLATQAYVAAYHTGAMFTHVRIGDHAAAPLIPGFFVFMAYLITAFRIGWLLSVAFTSLFIGMGIALGCCIVKKPEAERLLGEQDIEDRVDRR